MYYEPTVRKRKKKRRNWDTGRVFFCVGVRWDAVIGRLSCKSDQIRIEGALSLGCVYED